VQVESQDSDGLTELMTHMQAGNRGQRDKQKPSTGQVFPPSLPLQLGIVMHSADLHIQSAVTERLGKKQQLVEALEEHQAQSADKGPALFGTLLAEYAKLLETEAEMTQRLSMGRKQLKKEQQIQDRLHQHLTILDEVPQEMLDELCQVQLDIESNCQQLAEETASNRVATETLNQIHHQKVAIEEMVHNLYHNNHKAVGLLQTELLEFGIRNADLEVQNLELHRKIAKLIMSKDLAQPNRPLKAQNNTPSSDLVQLPNGIVPTCPPYVHHIQTQKRQIKSSHDSRQTGLISPRTPEARVESERAAVLLETPQGTQACSVANVSSLSRAERNSLINQICDRYSISKQPAGGSSVQHVYTTHSKPKVPPIVPPLPLRSTVQASKVNVVAPTGFRAVAMDCKTKPTDLTDKHTFSSTTLPSQGLWDFLKLTKEMK